ncbi:MAG: serine/threonine-protein kinase [Ardenticatenales bacterium]
MNRELLHRRYRLVSAIGEGGSGAVWLADDERLPGRQCAIKAIAVPAGIQADDVRRLRDALRSEATTLARLDHPALPKVSDAFETGSADRPGTLRLHLVMDYVPGRDLMAVLEDARRRDRFIDETELLSWAEDLCAALQYLHGHRPPIIHRDIKPANVKLTPDGQLKLVDFGLAIAVASDEGASRTIVTGGGTRAYQPLEQYGDAAALDARADLYSLGATLYHLLTARAPAAASERFIDAAVLLDPHALRSDARSALPEVVLACLALHPDDRPADAAAVRRMLRAAGTPSPATKGDAAVPSGTALSWSDALWRQRVVVAAALVLLAVAAALSLWP